MRSSWFKVGVPALLVVALVAGSVFAGITSPKGLGKEAENASIQQFEQGSLTTYVKYGNIEDSKTHIIWVSGTSGTDTYTISPYAGGTITAGGTTNCYTVGGVANDECVVCDNPYLGGCTLVEDTCSFQDIQDGQGIYGDVSAYAVFNSAYVTIEYIGTCES